MNEEGNGKLNDKRASQDGRKEGRKTSKNGPIGGLVGSSTLLVGWNKVKARKVRLVRQMNT